MHLQKDARIPFNGRNECEKQILFLILFIFQSDLLKTCETI